MVKNKLERWIITLDYLVSEFVNEEPVCTILKEHRNRYLNQLVSSYIYNKEYEKIKDVFEKYGTQNDKWIKYWVNIGYPSIIRDIFNSKSYKVGRSIINNLKRFTKLNNN